MISDVIERELHKKSQHRFAAFLDDDDDEEEGTNHNVESCQKSKAARKRQRQATNKLHKAAGEANSHSFSAVPRSEETTEARATKPYRA